MNHNSRKIVQGTADHQPIEYRRPRAIENGSSSAHAMVRPGEAIRAESYPSPEQGLASDWIGKRLHMELDTGTLILARVLSIHGGLLKTDQGIIRMDKLIYVREWADQS